MRNLRYNCATSLDGFIAPPDRTTNWIVNDPSIDFEALYAEFGTFILGRKTYEELKAQGEHNPLKSHSKDSVFVVSGTLREEDCSEVTLIRDDIASRVRSLMEMDGKDIWLFGGAELAGLCLDAGLLTTIEVAIMPVLLQDGVKLMTGKKESALKPKLELGSVNKLETGILMCRYNVTYEVEQNH